MTLSLTLVAWTATCPSPSGGEGWLSLSLRFECGFDGAQCGGEIADDELGRDPDEAHAGCFNRLLTAFVRGLLSGAIVNRPVDLDDKALLRAVEIYNEWTDRLLAPELHAVQVPRAESVPQGFLGGRRATSQFSRELVRAPCNILRNRQSRPRIVQLRPRLSHHVSTVRPALLPSPLRERVAEGRVRAPPTTQKPAPTVGTGRTIGARGTTLVLASGERSFGRNHALPC